MSRDIYLTDWVFRYKIGNSKTHSMVLKKNVLCVKEEKSVLFNDPLMLNRALRGMSATEKKKMTPFDIIFKKKIGETCK
jgi:hypothetical protein